MILLGAAAVAMAVLYALHRVTVPSFAAAAYNAGIIVCALLLARPLGVVGLVIGLLVGAAAQLALQLYSLRDRAPRLTLDVNRPAVRRIARLYAPVAGGLVVSALVVVLDTRLASLTGEASLAAMRYATQVVQLPLGLVATALSFAVLPVLSRYGAVRAGRAIDPAFRETLALGVRAALVLITPMTVALVVLRAPVIALLFGYGAFGERDAEITSTALLFYAPQLPFVAVDQLLIAAFYALQNTLLPVLVGVVVAAIYAVVAFATVEPMGMAGLVLANTLQNAAHAVILFAILARRHADAVPPRLLGTLARVGAAGALMVAACAGYQYVFEMPARGLPLAVHLSGGLALGAAAYLAALAVVGGEEVALVRGIVSQRLRGRRGAAS